MMQLSRRIEAVQPPIIPIIGTLSSSTPGTLSLAQGMVSYAPPPGVASAISEKFMQPDTHQYGPAQGERALLHCINNKLISDNNINTAAGYKVIVTAGSNMAFLNAILAICDPDDEIILLSPYYFNHEMAISMINCKAVSVPTDATYQPDLNAIEHAISAKTRALVTISPNNPSGAVYSKETLIAINQICASNNLYHISDEAYEYFTYETAVHYSPSSFEQAHGHTISIFSLSKAYAFAGWRVGYMLVPEHLYDAILKIQDTNLICPPKISQYAAIAAMQAGRSYCLQQQTEILTLRQWIIKRLEQERSLIECQVTNGAFYFLIKINTALDQMILVKKLIKEYKVAVLPGFTFGLEQGCYLRISYGKLDLDSGQLAIERLVKGICNSV